MPATIKPVPTTPPPGIGQRGQSCAWLSWIAPAGNRTKTVPRKTVPMATEDGFTASPPAGRLLFHSLGLLQHPERILTEYLLDVRLGVPALEKTGCYVGKSRDVAGPFG